MEAVVAIKMVVTARIKAITTRVAITHLKEINKDPSEVNDQTPEVEQETITTITNSSLARTTNTGTCPSSTSKRKEEGGKSIKEMLLQAKFKRKSLQTNPRRSRRFLRSPKLRSSPNTRRSRRCRVWKCWRSPIWDHRSTLSIVVAKRRL